MERIKPKKVAILLDRLKGFKKPKAKFEQWRTPGKIAADLAFFSNPKGKKVIDLGCGTGILAIACKLFKAKKVVGVDIDREAIEIARENARELGVEIDFIEADVLSLEIEESFDIAVMNPPFGSVKRHIDRAFVEKGIEIADEVFAILSSKARDFWIKRYGGVLLRTYKFFLKRQQWFHKKEKEVIEVDLIYFS